MAYLGYAYLQALLSDLLVELVLSLPLALTEITNVWRHRGESLTVAH